MSGDDPGVVGITQRELLMEMREDIKGLTATIDVIAKDQALGVERRQIMHLGPSLWRQAGGVATTSLS